MSNHASLPPRNFGLDVIRGLAVTLVLICHARPLLPAPFEHDWQRLWLLGHAGVDLFFVLSGFLIGRILLREIGPTAGWRQVRHFWIRRWFRTLPNYVLALAGVAVLTWHYNVFDFARLSSHLLFVQNLAWAPTSVFPVAWSLAVEEWFYLSAPLLLLAWAGLCRRWEMRFDAWPVIAGMILLPLAARGWCTWQLSSGWRLDTLIRGIVICRLDAIGYGVLLARLMTYPKVRAWLERHRTIVAAVGAAGWVWTTVGLGWTGQMLSPLPWLLLLSLGPACVVGMLPAAMHWRPPRRVGVVRAVTFLSVTSYSLYLYHWFVRFVLLRLGEYRATWLADTAWGVAVALGIYVVGSLVIAAVVYRYYERPMTALRDRFSCDEPRKINPSEQTAPASAVPARPSRAAA